MTPNAPRLLSRGCYGSARGAWLPLCMWLAFLLSGVGAFAEDRMSCVEGDGVWLKSVCFLDLPGPDRYGHAVLGNTPEWDELVIRWADRRPPSVGQRDETVLGFADHVYEDLSPRVADLDADGVPEIIVVQSSFTKGARLVVYRFGQTIESVTTPYIGTRFRWLAPAGISDLDGDGAVELAFVDRPHLAKRLRLWRYKDGQLHHLGDKEWLTNHRIGEAFISGGLRVCAGAPQIVTANANWTRLMATTFDGVKITTHDIGRFTTDALANAMDCR